LTVFPRWLAMHLSNSLKAVTCLARGVQAAARTSGEGRTHHELEATLTKSKDAHQYLQDEDKDLRIQNYGSVNGLNAVLMARQIDAFIRKQNGITRQEILSAIERPMEIHGLAEFLKAYVDDLLNEGTIVRMPDGNREVLRWVK